MLFYNYVLGCGAIRSLTIYKNNFKKIVGTCVA
jgi:hypothetical protein